MKRPSLEEIAFGVPLFLLAVAGLVWICGAGIYGLVLSENRDIPIWTFAYVLGTFAFVILWGLVCVSMAWWRRK